MNPPTRRGLVRVWSSAAGAERFRRPTDVLLAIAAVLVLVVLVPLAATPGPIDQATASLATSLDGALGWLWGVGYALLTVWAAAVVVVPLFFRGHRRLTVDLAIAALVGLGLDIVLTRLATGQWPTDSAGYLSGTARPTETVAFLTMATAVLVTASPHLAHPLRILGRLLIALGMACAVGIGVTTLTGTAVSVAAGVLAAAAVHLVAGTPAGRPTEARVQDAIEQLGIEVSEVTDAAVQVPGVCVMNATRADGSPLLVKVYGRDAWDGQVVGSVWTALTRKGESPVLLRSRTERVEHEAMVTLLAQRAGVPVVPVLVAGRTDQGDALVISEAPGPTFAEMTDLSPQVLDAAWSAMKALHAAGIAHRDLTSADLALAEDGAVRIAEFDEAVVAPDPSVVAADRARLVAITATVVGPDRALDAAAAALPHDVLVETLPYLQPAVMDHDTLDRVGTTDWSLDDLRASAAQRLGIDVPPLEQLRRVTVKSVAIAAIVGIMAYTLIGMFAGVDLASLLQELATANFVILGIALVMSPFVQVALAFSTMGSSPSPLRYRPVLMLQYAIQFISLTLPSTAARIALEVRFFERFGLPAATAVTIGMVDSFSGFVVQIALILLILLSGLPAFTTAVSTSSTSTSTSSSPSLVALLIGLVLIAAILTLLVPRLRRRAFGRLPQIRAALRAHADQAKTALTVLRQPRKVITMISGNLGAQVIQAIILGVCLAAFGESASLSQLILINTAVCLLGGLMPVPGNMGVAEAGYTLGLQAIGVPSTIAMSTAIAFRLVTFYLPPLWGAFAMRWLHRREYV